MSTPKLDDHIAKDEQVHAELRGRFEVLFKVIRKWALVGGIMGGILGHAIHALEGCAMVQTTMPPAKNLTDALIECAVMHTDTDLEFEQCRAAARAKWLDAGAKE